MRATKAEQPDKEKAKKPAKPALKKHITVEGIEAAIKRYRGNISAVADFYRVRRKTIYRRIEESETLQDALADARESTKDLIENKLIDLALAGNEKSVHFYLSTQGKDRGYTTRSEISGTDGGPIEHRDKSAIEHYTDEELEAIIRASRNRNPSKAEGAGSSS